MPKVSVIIPSYNYGKFILETINSVLNQTYSDLECIVVDDGSTDETKQIVESIAKEDDRVKYIYKDNNGLSAARNTGLKYVSGEFIAFLDADDKWQENKLMAQVKVINKQDCDVVYSNFKYFNDKGVDDKVNNFELEELNIEKFIAQNPITGSASSVLMTRKLFDKVGFFDEELKACEDLDYWFRCFIEGGEFSFCNNADVLLRTHTQSMSMNYILMYDNHLKSLKKQIQIIERKKLDLSKFKAGIRERLGKIRWYAYTAKKRDLMIKSHLLGVKIIKLKYFNNLTIKQFIFDFFRKIK